MRLFLFALLCFAVVPAFARIGETLDEIDTRYGKPISPPHKDSTGLVAAEYLFGGMEISVSFLDGKSQGEAFQKPGFDNKLSNQEIEILLAANGFGADWIESEEMDFVNRRWTWGGGKMFALYPKIDAHPTLIIVTRQLQQKYQADKEKKERDNLNGF